MTNMDALMAGKSWFKMKTYSGQILWNPDSSVLAGSGSDKNFRIRDSVKVGVVACAKPPAQPARKMVE